MAEAIACAACSLAVPREAWNHEEGVRCRGCGQRVRAMVFPAVNHRPTGASPEALRGETEASCYYHPQSRAATVCGDCGRFLCNLCDLNGVCPRCFEAKLQTVEPRRTMWDTIALGLAIVPALVISPAIIGAPWSLFIVLRHWKTPGSILPRTKIRFVLAALFALGEIGFLIFIIYMAMQVGFKARPSRTP